MKSHRVLSALAISSLAFTVGACDDSPGKKDAASSPATSASAAAPSRTSTLTGKRPAEILAAAHNALRQAGSLRVAGTIWDDSPKAGVDMTMDAGKAMGRVTLPFSDGPATVEVIRVGDRTYVKSATLWQKVGGPQLAARHNGRWTLANPEMSKDFSEFSTIKGWIGVLKPQGKLSRRADTEVGGQPAVALVDGTKTVLHIAAQGTPYPLRLSGGTRKAGAKVSFTYGVPVNVTAPPNPLPPPTS